MRSSWPWPTGSPQICRVFHRKRSSGEIPRPIRQGPPPQSADARERTRDEESRDAQGAALWPPQENEENEEEVRTQTAAGKNACAFARRRGRVVRTGRARKRILPVRSSKGRHDSRRP